MHWELKGGGMSLVPNHSMQPHELSSKAWGDLKLTMKKETLNHPHILSSDTLISLHVEVQKHGAHSNLVQQGKNFHI